MPNYRYLMTRVQMPQSDFMGREENSLASLHKKYSKWGLEIPPLPNESNIGHSASEKKEASPLSQQTPIGILRQETENRLQYHYRQRMRSLYHGAVYAHKALKGVEQSTSFNKLLKEYEKKINQLEENGVIDIKEYQALLKNYTAALVKMVNTACEFDDFTTAAKILNKGEEYFLLAQGRKSVVTISSFTIHGQEYVLYQMEEPLLNLTEALVDDYWKISQKEDHEKLPSWYNAMNDTEKNLLDYALTGVKYKSEIQDRLATISSRLRTIPGVANFSRHSYKLFAKNGDSFQALSKSERIRSSMITSRDVKGESDEIRHRHGNENLQKIVDEQVAFLLKTHLKSLDVKEGNKVTIPLLVSTLISPFKQGFLKKEPDYSLYKDKQNAINAIKALKDVEIEVDGKKYTVNFKVFSTNHPQNILKRLVPTKRKSETGKALQELINYARDKAKEPKLSVERSENISEAKKTCGALQALLDDDGFFKNLTPWGDSHGRELFLASLEQVLTKDLGGIAYGSCVSGKDRKGIETIHTDAMFMYRDIYKKLPSYYDKGEDRQNFCNIFAHIYATRHQQYIAQQNAPGAAGLKTPKMYLPKDIYKAVEKALDEKRALAQSNIALSHEDRLASNNEVKSIISFKQLKKLEKKEKLQQKKNKTKEVKEIISEKEEAANETFMSSYSYLQSIKESQIILDESPVFQSPQVEDSKSAKESLASQSSQMDDNKNAIEKKPATANFLSHFNLIKRFKALKVKVADFFLSNENASEASDKNKPVNRQ
ncbi:MAG: hypothetical protein ACX932_02250 [Gammaproteobacteria bacterium]